ncbi:MAG: TetR/AcrR family transcriptional regulator [Gammaproteobacteria bacterium]|nr:MAG: TetR/AcrR family transcriptional regulator [Gammaproteobacteria bacterium]
MSETRARKIPTKEKVLHAAEVLFAEHGFTETSLRQITERAGVNLASVNYHFGSKKALIQAVFERFLAAYFETVDERLIEIEKNNQINARTILRAMGEALLSLDKMRPDGMSIFLKLLWRAYAESQGHLRKLMMLRHGHTARRFFRLVYQALPNRTPEDIFWRLHFAMGATVFALSGKRALSEISEDEFGVTSESEAIVERLVDFISGGLATNS